MDRSLRGRVSGPLAGYASGFREALLAQGYAPSSVQAHILLMARLSRWLGGAAGTGAGLSSQQLAEFLRVERESGRRRRLGARGMAQLVSYLRGAGAVVPTEAVLSANEELLERFRQYLLDERGLVEGTVVNYVYVAGRFLKALDCPGRCDLSGLTVVDVNEFLLAESGTRNAGSMKVVVTGLRSLLRFLHVQGLTSGSLSAGVPAVAGWSGSSLPRAISPEWVRRLLGSCDRQTVKGRRDLAVLVLLARLGMRAGEVAALKLSDVDWRDGLILVRGKGNRLERLPLLVDVGEALAGYVQRGRPRGRQPNLFLGLAAPHRALPPNAITMIVYAACGRAGLPRLGAHRLRHTVASELLRAGAGLPEIGQVLRHRSNETTAIYAKLDTAALRQLARPWPGDAA